MEHCVSTPLRGWKLIPRREWDGKDNTYEFVIRGISDSDYAASKDSIRIASGWSVYLEGAPISVKSSMQNTAASSVAEAELMVAVSCAQDMLYTKRIME